VNRHANFLVSALLIQAVKWLQILIFLQHLVAEYTLPDPNTEKSGALPVIFCK
jgi:hypothetical protein